MQWLGSTEIRRVRSGNKVVTVSYMPWAHVAGHTPTKAHS